MNVTLTTKGRILNRLIESEKALAVHEFGFKDVSENTIASRLPELAKEGYVIGKTRPGKSFKEWAIAPPLPSDRVCMASYCGSDPT